MNEKEVFIQEVSDEELQTVAGGVDDCGWSEYTNCSTGDKRYIYSGGFPNCAATVEDGSWCGTNDACLQSDVDYQGMNDCERAWH